jgi:ABC-type dipeptide/oligopeptide/nickel transport system permease component
MEDIELKNIWRSYDRKIEEARLLNLQSWALNLRCFESIQVGKAKSKLQSLSRFKIFAVVLGIVWVLFLGLLVAVNHFNNIFFSVSVTMVMLFSIFAIAVYIKHIILINQINYSENITDTQKKLAALELSTIHSTRIVWLQLPFYTTWFWSSQFIRDTGIWFWLIVLPVALLFCAAAIFLSRNITTENMHKKWVRALMMAGPEYTSVIKAREFITEIEAFKKDFI